MGEFNWPVGVWSADRERMETVDALVDTGSSYSMFSGAMLRRLGIVTLERHGFELADRSIVEYDVGEALLRVNGRERTTSVMFGDDDAEPLLGANALQEFLLVVDPVGEELIPRTGRMKADRQG
jgi:clan AA aspartic protease